MKSLYRSKKRMLAFMLTGVMCLSNFAFGASVNSVDKIPKVTDGTWLEQNNAPKLRIEENSPGEFNGEQVFQLRLTNGEWLLDADTQLESIVEDQSSDNLNYEIQFKRLSETVMKIYLSDFLNTQASKAALSIPILARVTNPGEVIVEVNSLDSAITADTYTVAVAATPSVNIVSEDIKDFSDGIVTLAPIHIEEEVPESMLITRRTKIEIITSGFIFASTDTDMSFSGGFSGNSISYPLFESGTEEDFFCDEHDYTIRGSIKLSNIRIKALDNANEGMVQLRISGRSLPDEYIVSVANYSGIATNEEITTTSTINKTINVSPKFSFNFEEQAPHLRIEFPDNVIITDDQVFRLRLTNATWLPFMGENLFNDLTYATVTLPNKRTAEIIWDSKVSRGYIEIPLMCKVSNKGDVKVEIIPLDSDISENQLTLAQIVENSSHSTLNETIEVQLGDNTLPKLTIDEGDALSVGSKVNLILNKGYVWTDSGNIYLEDGLSSNEAFGALKGRKLTIRIDSNEAPHDFPGTLTLSDAVFKPLNKATEGPVKLTITGNGITKQSLVIGNYNKPLIGYSIATNELVEISSKNQTLQDIVITENIQHGIEGFGNKTLRLTLPKGFTWKTAGSITLEGAFESKNITLSTKGRNLLIKSDFSYSSNDIGKIIISNAVIKIQKSAKLGSIKAKVHGKGSSVSEIHLADYIK